MAGDLHVATQHVDTKPLTVGGLGKSEVARQVVELTTGVDPPFAQVLSMRFERHDAPANLDVELSEGGPQRPRPF